uniref:Uncharacterized protein n=1 Tax=Rhizophora mucronata TaxID=61149 RepID=A0A2P2PDN6_RHIMU
MSFVSIKQNPG